MGSVVDIQSRKILIVAPAWIGDMVMAQALVNLLVRNDADTQIHMLAPVSTRAVAERMMGVSRVLSISTEHGELGLSKRIKTAWALRAEEYTQAVILPNSWKSALVPFLADIPVRTGWRGEYRYGLLNDLRILHEQNYPRMVDRFLALGLPATRASGVEAFDSLELQGLVPRLRVDQKNLQAQRARFHLSEPKVSDSKQPVIALCPGAEFGPAKQWPAAHFAALADHCLKAGAEVWILGSESDRAIAEGILGRISFEPNAQSRRIHNLAGQTRLLDAIDLLSAADLVVTNDSGLMHVAAALKVPVVALFGSTSPDFTPPLGPGRVLQENLPCQPCFKRSCPLQHLNCLNQLSVARVIQAVSRVLSEGGISRLEGSFVELDQKA